MKGGDSTKKGFTLKKSMQSMNTPPTTVFRNGVASE